MIQGDALRRLQETRPESLLGVQANVPHPPGRPENLENGIGAMGGDRWYNNGARSGGVAGQGQMGNVGSEESTKMIPEQSRSCWTRGRRDLASRISRRIAIWSLRRHP
jgi:hypothetical protein